MAEPEKKAENGDGRDPETGRFVKGYAGGPGRPPGIDMKALVRHRAEEVVGEPPETSMLAVYAALLKKAKHGDVAAAKLLFDRLLEADAQKLDITHTPALSTEERARRIKQLFEKVQKRQGDDHDEREERDATSGIGSGGNGEHSDQGNRGAQGGESEAPGDEH